jgi:cyclopropane fatty-acyl-phospholipid synthase-like methyltransferase
MTGIFDSDSTKVMECGQCGMQYLDPVMTDQEESNYYEGYYRKQKIRHFKAMDLEDLQQRAYDHYEQYRSVYLDLISECKTLLEIGSGSGGFLRFVREQRPDIRLFALERCSENVEFIHQCFDGQVLVLDSLDQVAGEKFDCIGAFGVFEHVKNSREFLSNLRNYLSANGKLALNVPNKMHPLVYVYGLEEFKKFTYMKQHYFTFTEEAFRLLAKQTELRVKKFNYIQVWGLDNHLSWLSHKKPRDFSDVTKLLSKQTLDSYSRDMAEKKMTDVVMAVLCLND